MSNATITVVGRLSADAVITPYGDDANRISFSIPVNHPSKDTTKTAWYNIVCFGYQAATAIKLINMGAMRKGQEIVVIGRLTPNNYVSTRTGEKRVSLDVIADSFTLVGNRETTDTVADAVSLPVAEEIKVTF